MDRSQNLVFKVLLDINKIAPIEFLGATIPMLSLSILYGILLLSRGIFNTSFDRLVANKTLW